MNAGVEQLEFQAEARQLLDLMVHSVYSNKDSFLRELISNASDALDKLRIEAFRNKDLDVDTSDLHIEIVADHDARTLTVRDNGIGMTRAEVVDLIGTLAKSGTAELRQQLRDAQNAKNTAVSEELIGQFGIGFYSTFMVADRVTILTRRAGEEQGWLWESTGDGSFTIEEASRPTHGTTVTLHLKPTDTEDAVNDYSDEWTLRTIIKKYSDFVSYPIKMRVERQEAAKDEEGKPIEGEMTTVVEDQTLNSMKALWTRSREQVTDVEYREFYKHISHDWNDPLSTIQMKGEGTFEYYALLFIPSKAPFDLYFREAHRGLQLYVKRIFILDDAEQLLPPYLRFVKGVVDAEDLPLNISREILQENRQIQAIRKRLTKRIIDTLVEMKRNEPEKFRSFWGEFGGLIKEGIYQDFDNRAQLLELVLASSTAVDGLTSLDEYVARMKEGQNEIYFLNGESAATLRSSPLLEAFAAKGYEVLLLSEPVDSVWTEQAGEYQGKRLRSVAKGGIDLGTEEEKRQSEERKMEAMQQHGALLTLVKEKLDAYVKEVRLSDRLTTSATCLVGDQNDMSPQLERLLRGMGQEVGKTKRIMEINPSHPVLAKMQEIYNADNADPRLGEYAQLLYGQAVLAEGGELPDPAAFGRLVADLMVKAS